MTSPPFILASKSAIRASLLRQAGLEIEIIPAAVDERALEEPWRAAGRGPADVARGLAEEKARDVSLLFPDRVVLGADQTLALGDRRFSKVTDRASAKGQIAALAGQTHALHSGYAVVRGGAVLASGVATARLTMRALDDRAIDTYLDQVGDRVFGSVGCYQLEGLGVRLFTHIEGDYFTILGLPVLDVLADLRSAGLLGDGL